jgi:Domain of unknown function (DUF4398)
MCAGAPTHRRQARIVIALVDDGRSAVSTATTIGISMNPPFQIHRRTRLRASLGLAGVALLAACASTPPPTAKLQAAHEAIATAEQAQAGQYAAGELSEARMKIASADSAVHDQNMVSAARLADESSTEANLATAKTMNVKAQAVNAQMQQSNATLINEMQRSGGATP